MSRKRTSKEERNKCCNNCQYAKIKNFVYDNYLCKFTCELHSHYSDNASIRGFLDKHYCEDFKAKEV